MAERLFIFDAHSLIYQVFHAIPEMTGPSGTPTNAVYGFVRDIEFVRRQKKPEYFVVAMDSSGPTFRHGMFDGYKATRSEMPDDLRPQIAVIRRILDAYRIPVLAEPGMEADDFLATVAARCSDRKIDCMLCTADKDVRQCITDHVSIYDLRKNRIIDRDYLIKDWGVTPEQVIDYQAMVGDSVDTIPGIKGVGPKTASSLLQKFGSLEAIYEHMDEVPGAKCRENFYKGRELGKISRELVKLRTDLTVPDDWSSWRIQEPDREALLAIFAECGFHRFADDLRAEAIEAGAPATEAGVPQKSSLEADWQAEYVAVTTPEQFDVFFKELSAQSRISFDLETTSLHPCEAEIVGYAISWTPGKGYFISVRAPAGQTSLDPDSVVERMRPILENPEIEKIGQNLKYDLMVLRTAGVELRGIAFDSMLGSYLLEPGERIHNLDQLSLRYLRHSTIKIVELIGKATKNTPQLRMDQVDVPKIAEYAGEDADVALRLTNILEPKVKEAGLDSLMTDLEVPLIDVLAEMEYNGIRVDTEKLAALSTDFAERLDLIRAEAYAAAGREFNLDSPTQLRAILFDELNLPVIKRTKTGPSTDEEVLDELADHHPLCALLKLHRSLAKLKGTYVDSLPTLICAKTGRIHTSFNQTVAATGRLSSSEPNLQNIPIRTDEGQKIRAAFLPGADGQVLLCADYSQIELRFLAHFSGDANLKRAFEEGIDIHSAVAARISGVEPDAVDAEMRRRAKAVNFGIMYGLSPFGLARQLKIDQDSAARFIDAYLEQYPGIDAFFTTVLEGAKKQGSVSTILGRRRPISGIKNTTGRSRNLPERTAINTVIQGSAADLIKKAMLAIHRRLKSEDFAARMLLQIHDELVFEVAEDRAMALARMVNDEMTGAMKLDGVPLKVDMGVGPNWHEQSPLEAFETAAAG